MYVNTLWKLNSQITNISKCISKSKWNMDLLTRHNVISFHALTNIIRQTENRVTLVLYNLCNRIDFTFKIVGARMLETTSYQRTDVIVMWLTFCCHLYEIAVLMKLGRIIKY